MAVGVAMTAADLQTQIDDYLTFRRSLGCKLEVDECLLADFARYADTVDHLGHWSSSAAIFSSL